MAKQKFFRGQRVHICKDLGSSMFHFESDVDAIVMGSYSDIYRGDNVDSFSLLVYGRKPKHWYSCSWYNSWQLTLVDKDRDKGEKILQKYKNR